MATQPPPETPAFDPMPVPSTSPSPEISPPGPDYDQPAPTMPNTDPGTVTQPEM
ncbi:hypothetical protein [Sphingomonas bacterium]|uniref:hypothetical protein n=1 Tax=Sphingomonas bacterium TaxID=1895847 RepID=UPI001574FA63|nr:hypothetical protein [Sphingomonas bacterium]